MRKLLSLSIVAAALLLLPPGSTEACMECDDCIYFGRCLPCPPSHLTSDGEVFLEEVEPVEVRFPAKNRAVIKVPGYLTTHLQIGQGCVVAFPPAEGVEKVNAVVNFDSRFGQPFNEVAFDYDQAAGTVVADFMDDYFGFGGGEPWEALISEITGNVNDGVPNHFLVDVSLEKGVTPHEFVKVLREEGMFLTAAAHDGAPYGGDDGGHVFLKSFADYPMIVRYPSIETTKPAPSRR